MSSSEDAVLALVAPTDPPTTNKTNRLEINHQIFLTNIEAVSSSLSNCIALVKEKLDNYEGTSKNVPLTLRPILENLDMIRIQLDQASSEMINKKMDFLEKGSNVDGRGTWAMLLKFLLKIVKQINHQVGKLPFISKPEAPHLNVSRRYTQSVVLPILSVETDNLKVLAAAFPTIYLATFYPETVNDDEAKSLLSTLYTHPFWYEYDSGMVRFRNLFDLLKMSILNSYNKTGFFSRTWAQGLNSIQALLTSHKMVSKNADELGRKHANMKFVKSLWNLAETGIPEKVVSWMKPNIKVREYFALPVNEDLRSKHSNFSEIQNVRFLYLYHDHHQLISIPRNWKVSGPKVSKEAKAQLLVASTLQDVDKQHAAQQDQVKSEHDKLKHSAELQLASEKEKMHLKREVQHGNTSINAEYVDDQKDSSEEATFTSDATVVTLPDGVESSEANTLASPSPMPSEISPTAPNQTSLDLLFEELPIEPFIQSLDPEITYDEPKPLKHFNSTSSPVPSSSYSPSASTSTTIEDTEDITDKDDPALSGVLHGIAPKIDGNCDVILHFHGGGFVSGSPSSHESYLRTWANTTNAIVFSVDYSLGPEHKYPVAFNECFLFYHWLVSDDNNIGIKPRKLVVAGDSAGGNLALAVALKAAETGIRKPDGIVAAYPAVDCTKGATPSRVLFGNDILVPYYFLEVCLDGYVDTDKSDPKTDYCISPLHAPTELLMQLPDDIVFMSAGYDPLLDDTVRFLRRLDELNKPYIFEVFECPHGFWNFDAILSEAENAMYRAGSLIRCIFDPDYAKIWQITEVKNKRKKESVPDAIRDALRSYPSHIPKTFTPLSEKDVLYHLTQQKKAPSKRKSMKIAKAIHEAQPNQDDSAKNS